MNDITIFLDGTLHADSINICGKTLHYVYDKWVASKVKPALR